MVDDAELLERVRRLLEPERDVVEKRMSGSTGSMVGGVLRVGVGRHRDQVMMGRVALADEAEALRMPGVHPAVMAGRPRRGRLFFEDDAVASDELLARMIAPALTAET